MSLWVHACSIFFIVGKNYWTGALAPTLLHGYKYAIDGGGRLVNTLTDKLTEVEIG